MRFKRLFPEAILPTKAHAEDAGYDLYARKEVRVTFGHVTQVPTGIAVDIPTGAAGLIWPRSGLATRAGVDVLAGVVDCGYQGEIKVLLTKLTPGQIEIPADKAVAQLVVQPIWTDASVEEVDDFDAPTARGTRGFGSSDPERQLAERVSRHDP